MSEEPKKLKEYIEIFNRRKLMFFLPIMLIFSLSVVIALKLPSVYRSSATILIEAQEIPRELIRSIVTGMADQRIQIIKQRVMRRSSLLAIIEEYDLYGEMRKKSSTEEVLAKMTDNMDLEIINAEGMNPQMGQSSVIAFTLSFEGENPSVVQKVNNELTSLFLAENLKLRKRNAQVTTTFLRLEAEKLSTRTQEVEEKIAGFKIENSGALPELLAFNMQLIEQTNRSLQDVDQQTQSLKDRQGYLKSQLSFVLNSRSNRFASAENDPDKERLNALKTEYIRLAAHLSKVHPDLIRMKREINSLSELVGEIDDRHLLEDQLENKKKHLSRAC